MCYKYQVNNGLPYDGSMVNERMLNRNLNPQKVGCYVADRNELRLAHTDNNI